MDDLLLLLFVDDHPASLFGLVLVLLPVDEHLLLTVDDHLLLLPGYDLILLLLVDDHLLLLPVDDHLLLLWMATSYSSL